MWDDVFEDKYETRYTVKIEHIESLLEYVKAAYFEVRKNSDYNDCAINICLDYSTALISLFPVNKNDFKKRLNLVFNFQILDLLKQFKATRIKWYRDDMFRSEETKTINAKVFGSLDLILKEVHFQQPVVYSYYKTEPSSYENIMEEYQPNING